MHCFASENQTYTGTWLFGVESWKSIKGQENLLLKNLQVKTRVENVRFLSWRVFVGKYGIQSTNEMAFKRTVTLRASFRFPAIRFDAPTLLSFSGFTHAHAKCPPVRPPQFRRDSLRNYYTSAFYKELFWATHVNQNSELFAILICLDATKFILLTHKDDLPKKLFKITAQKCRKARFRLMCVAQKRRCFSPVNADIVPVVVNLSKTVR